MSRKSLRYMYDPKGQRLTVGVFDPDTTSFDPKHQWSVKLSDVPKVIDYKGDKVEFATIAKLYTLGKKAQEGTSSKAKGSPHAKLKASRVQLEETILAGRWDSIAKQGSRFNYADYMAHMEKMAELKKVSIETIKDAIMAELREVGVETVKERMDAFATKHKLVAKEPESVDLSDLF